MNKIKIIFLDLSFVVIIAFIYSLFQGVGIRKIIGSLIALLGLVCWFIARHHLGGAWSIKPQAKTIVNTGIYKKIRHPIYFFSSIAVFGVCVMYNLWWMYVLAGLLIIVQLLRMRAEETILTKTFGQEYIEYKKSTWF